jgi:hypothetical protein
VVSSCNATVAPQRQGSQLPRGRNDIQRIRPVFSRFFQAMMIADHDRTQAGALNPNALTPASLARLLTRVAGQPVTEEMIEADLTAGAPLNADGTINLVHYCAWLAGRWATVTDPRRMRPSELCRLLNSTPLGEVINERQLFRHRTRAGVRIGDERHVDLLRYGAWLVQQRHRRVAPGRQPGAEGTRGLRLPALLRLVLPADVPPGVVA